MFQPSLTLLLVVRSCITVFRGIRDMAALLCSLSYLPRGWMYRDLWPLRSWTIAEPLVLLSRARHTGNRHLSHRAHGSSSQDSVARLWLWLLTDLDRLIPFPELWSIISGIREPLFPFCERPAGTLHVHVHVLALSCWSSCGTCHVGSPSRCWDVAVLLLVQCPRQCPKSGPFHLFLLLTTPSLCHRSLHSLLPLDLQALFLQLLVLQTLFLQTLVFQLITLQTLFAMPLLRANLPRICELGSSGSRWLLRFRTTFDAGTALRLS